MEPQKPVKIEGKMNVPSVQKLEKIMKNKGNNVEEMANSRATIANGAKNSNYDTPKSEYVLPQDLPRVLPNVAPIQRGALNNVIMPPPAPPHQPVAHPPPHPPPQLSVIPQINGAIPVSVHVSQV